MESKAGRIILLVFMIAVLIYTIVNYAQGGTNVVTFGAAVIIGVMTIPRLVLSLIDDFRKK